MPQLLAIEWNESEARGAVASRHGDRLVVEQAFAIPLQPASPDKGSAEQLLGQTIAEALAARGIGPLDALVAVGRGSVELRQLQLPAAPDDELPGMVRLRAMLEFNELDDKWLLDFVPIDDASKPNRNVLAAAVAPEVVERIQAVCRRSGLRVQRVSLRACEAAAALSRAKIAPSDTLSDQVQLLVELFADHVDLTAAVDGRVLLPRMVRWTGELSDSVALQGLLTEIRLTTAAVENQFSGRKVAGIVLCGRGETDAALARQIEGATSIRTTLLDPFAGLNLGPRLIESPPEHPGRFAAVLGMLLTECKQGRQTIDFLHPRQTALPADPRIKWAMAAAVAVLLALGYLVYGRLAYRQLNDEVRRLEVRSSEADGVLRTAGSRNLAVADEIAKWTEGEVVWLDRLRELSEDLPPAEVATIDHLLMSCQLSRSTGSRSMNRTSDIVEIVGRMQIEGRARDSKSVTAMEKSLGDHGRRLESSKTEEDRSLPPPTVKFRATVQVGRGAKP